MAFLGKFGLPRPPYSQKLCGRAFFRVRVLGLGLGFHVFKVLGFVKRWLFDFK